MTMPTETRHFFVDEAGDLTLFDRRGRIIVGREGVSKTFMVGVAYLPDPEGAKRTLDALRAELLADPYFKDVPSIQPTARKTAICFHAKDDLPEVRREVFRVLPTLDPKVQVAIRRKSEMAAEARFAWRKWKHKPSADDQYDDLVKRLFKNLLHKGDENHIAFSRRGKSDRQDALQATIARAKANFEAKWRKPSDRPTRIVSASPSESAGLQVIDYYLWALQRTYERGEDRFFELLRPDYRLIMDLDDDRNKPYGEWYSDKNPLTLEKKMPVAG
jgi:Protein of unknown function (DUF3800)